MVTRHSVYDGKTFKQVFGGPLFHTVAYYITQGRLNLNFQGHQVWDEYCGVLTKRAVICVCSEYFL